MKITKIFIMAIVLAICLFAVSAFAADARGEPVNAAAIVSLQPVVEMVQNVVVPDKSTYEASVRLVAALVPTKLAAKERAIAVPPDLDRNYLQFVRVDPHRDLNLPPNLDDFSLKRGFSGRGCEQHARDPTP